MSSESSTFKVESKDFSKVIKVPTSKSYGNRLLILAAIEKEPVRISQIPLSSDVLKMIEVLSSIGLDISVLDDTIEVKNSFPECENAGPHILETGDGGTTNRFLVPFLARGKEEYILRPEGHMRQRPMDPLVNVLKEAQVEVSYSIEDENWITIKGPAVLNQEVFVDSSQSTQFVTGMALAYADSKVTVAPKNLSVSVPYWNLSQELIRKFKSKELNYVNPVDFSSMSYPLALAAVTGDVLISNCHSLDELQADSQFIEVLKDMGVQIEFSEEGLSCKKRELRGVVFDGSQCPDVIPTLLFVCSFAEGESHIKNLEVLTHKECDRFEEMLKMLKAFNVSFEADREKYEIKILGPVKVQEAIQYDPPADHRMVMVAYLFMRALKGGVVTNSHHVKKSFANFFDVMS